MHVVPRQIQRIRLLGQQPTCVCIAATPGLTRAVFRNRWIEAEREEALLGKTAAENNTVAHEAEAFMALGSGPRLCPGQVR